MGEGNHLQTTEKVAQPKGRWMWLFGGAAMAVVASGLLMQYVRGTITKAASSDPPAGSARVGEVPAPESRKPSQRSAANRSPMTQSPKSVSNDTDVKSSTI